MSTTLSKDGIVREIAFTMEPEQIDANAVCRMFSYIPGATIESLTKQPHFPVARKPAGANGQRRWIVDELRTWSRQYSLRESDAPVRKWAPDHPRRVAAQKRAEERAAAARARAGELNRVEGGVQ